VNRQVGPPYLGFQPQTSHAAARRVFQERYGVAPFELIRTGGALKVGPLPGFQPSRVGCGGDRSPAESAEKNMGLFEVPSEGDKGPPVALRRPASLP
jgi:hypothetical protein